MQGIMGNVEGFFQIVSGGIFQSLFYVYEVGVNSFDDSQESQVIFLVVRKVLDCYIIFDVKRQRQ